MDSDKGEFGTKESGFAEGGPFSCSNCVHSKQVSQQLVCMHPKVNADPELKVRDRASKFMVVGFDDCCRFVRPPEED